MVAAKYRREGAQSVKDYLTRIAKSRGAAAMESLRAAALKQVGK